MLERENFLSHFVMQVNDLNSSGPDSVGASDYLFIHSLELRSDKTDYSLIE
jgi:hypothetical protein